MGVSARPRKILHVITDLNVGGAETMLTRIATARPGVADETFVASLIPSGFYADRLRAAGVTVSEFDFRTPWGALSGLVRLARMIARVRPDIVQGWMYHGDLAALLALKMSRVRAPLAWGIRCSELDLRQYGVVLRGVIKACAALSAMPDLVTANSVAGMEAHRALGYRPRRAEIVANGIDVDRYKPDATARSAVRNELAIADDVILLAHVARRDPMKDHEGFLATMAELPDIQALAIGVGTEDLPRAANVHRLGRRVDVPRLLAAADVVVSSSAFGEGFSNVLAEGMACGLPAVATDVGDARLILGDTGLVVTPRDPRKLAGAVDTLARESRAARVARGQRARERIVDHFSLERAIGRFAEVYEVVLKEPG
jgi:glycosyltransferase involved in cell wall biosynthesis